MRPPYGNGPGRIFARYVSFDTVYPSMARGVAIRAASPGTRLRNPEPKKDMRGPVLSGSDTDLNPSPLGGGYSIADSRAGRR